MEKENAQCMTACSMCRRGVQRVLKGKLCAEKERRRYYMGEICAGEENRKHDNMQYVPEWGAEGRQCVQERIVDGMTVGIIYRSRV